MIDPGWVALGTEVPTVFKMNFAFFKLQNKKASVHLLKNDKKEIGNQLIWGGFVVDLRVVCKAIKSLRIKALSKVLVSLKGETNKNETAILL